MRLVKLGLGSVNSTVGAVIGNADRVIRIAGEMAADGVTVACLPEQVIGGYPAEGGIYMGATETAKTKEEVLAAVKPLLS